MLQCSTACRAEAAAKAAAAAAAAEAEGGAVEAGNVPDPPAAAVAEAVPARRTRRGQRAKAPPEPSALDVVKQAVAADPAREERIQKTEAQWKFKLSAKSLQVGAGQREVPS